MQSKSRFNEKDMVRWQGTADDNSGLVPASVGTVWAVYATEPPQYEVTFYDESGEPFDYTASEADLDYADLPRASSPKIEALVA